MGAAQSAPPKKPVERGSAFSVFVALGASLGGLLYGYDTGIIGSALLFLRDDFGIGDNAFLQSVITSITLLGAIAGAVLTGPLSDRLGRRKTVLVVSAAFIAFAIGCALAPDVGTLIAFRFLLGVPVGGASQIIPLYISELAPPKSRGSQAVLFQVMICVGTLLAYASGHVLGADAAWREMLGIAAIPAVLFLIAMTLLPESPRWLAIRGREAEARAVLRRVRADEASVEAEIHDIRQIDSSDTGTWTDLRRRWVRPALVAGVGVAFFSQATGISAIIYYAPSLLELAGFGTGAATLASIGVGVSLTVFTVLGIYLLERWGRRRLTLIGLPGAVVVLGIMAALLPWTASASASIGSGAQTVVVVCLLAYFAFNGGSLSVVAWLYFAEIFPLTVRGKGVSFCAFVLWVTNFLLTLVLLFAADGLGVGMVFGALAALNALAFVFVWFWMPETKGRTLEEIEASLRNGTFTPHRNRPVGRSASSDQTQKDPVYDHD
ncbi:sugar porter family MFS transporter [Streptomyces sp. NBC_00006]|uniref:sugar porter family MFS transporter n=1 Tax=unclassified Streptomyces TaxID=2593676 RepID=UPI00225632BC|nr:MULTISPECIES: sugar porter family MFS transporter [unclassified Streptomyces]MCX5529617.1 sugar porter family MFS transporter [Streptomyces sp. NBC_00006]